MIDVLSLVIAILLVALAGAAWYIRAVRNAYRALQQEAVRFQDYQHRALVAVRTDRDRLAALVRRAQAVEWDAASARAWEADAAAALGPSRNGVHPPRRPPVAVKEQH